MDSICPKVADMPTQSRGHGTRRGTRNAERKTKTILILPWRCGRRRRRWVGSDLFTPRFLFFAPRSAFRVPRLIRSTGESVSCKSS